MFPSQKRREVRAQTEERAVALGKPGPRRGVLQHRRQGEAEPPPGGGRSLAEPSQRGSALRGHSAAQPHPPLLLFIPPFQPAALQKQPTAAWFGVDQTRVAPKLTQELRRAGMIIPRGHLGEALLQGPLPPAAPPVTVDAPLPGQRLVQPVKNVT